MKQDLEGVVVRTTMWVNSQEVVAFITWPVSDETTETVVVNADARTDRLKFFILLLCASKLAYGRYEHLLEDMMRGVDIDIRADYDSWTDELGEIPF